jgi:hypothetical protein
MSNANAETTVVLGKEHDTELWRARREVLRTLNVEAETYIGLSVTGPTELIHTVAQMVRERVADGT